MAGGEVVRRTEFCLGRNILFHIGYRCMQTLMSTPIILKWRPLISFSVWGKYKLLLCLWSKWKDKKQILPDSRIFLEYVEAQRCTWVNVTEQRDRRGQR